MSEQKRYPLQWPTGWKREQIRDASRFRNTKNVGTQLLTLATGLRRLTDELERLHAGDVVISTDVPIRRDGMPYASATLPKDPGCAVYFTLKRKPMALACDRYNRLPDNMAALAAHIAALRAIERHGVGSVEQAFAGYAALPSRVEHATDWRAVLRLDAASTLATAEASYRRLARENHADAGGTHEAMVALNNAIANARIALT